MENKKRKTPCFPSCKCYSHHFSKSEIKKTNSKTPNHSTSLLEVSGIKDYVKKDPQCGWNHWERPIVSSSSNNLNQELLPLVAGKTPTAATPQSWCDRSPRNPAQSLPFLPPHQKGSQEAEMPSIPTVGCPTATLASTACSLLLPLQWCAAWLLLADIDG